MDVTKAINDIKSGKVEYRLDKNNIVHLGFGKVSFGAEKLEENLAHFIKVINEVKPTGAKGKYINTIYVCNAMGPSIKLDLEQL